MTSDGSFDSMRTENGSIMTELRSEIETPFVRLKSNCRNGVIPRSLLRDMQYIHQSSNRDRQHPDWFNWKLLNLSFYCKFVQEWRAIKIMAYNNECPILKDIKDISFPCLTWLNLSANHFMSIEVLGRVHLPRLENIQLPANCLVNVKALRKCVWPRIKNISLCNRFVNPARNEILEWQILAEMYIAKVLDNLEYFQNPDTTDFRFFMKMQSKKVPAVEMFDSSFTSERQQAVFIQRNSIAG